MKSEIELFNDIVEFNNTSRFMEDDQIDRALAVIVKAITSPDSLPPSQIPDLIVELQALASKFAVLATYYNGIGKAGADEAKKKNMYYTMKDAVSDLVNALKYKARGGYYGG